MEKKKLDQKVEKHKDSLGKSKSAAEKMMDDMVKSIKVMQNDLEKKISEYTEAVPEKPTIDVIETNENIILKTDLPGVNKKDIDIQLTEDRITIAAKFEEKIEIEEANYIKKERKYGEALRELRLPSLVVVEEATAKFKNGVLTVDLPKVEVKKKFNVNIE
jgi:HSP20 family protein